MELSLLRTTQSEHSTEKVIEISVVVPVYRSEGTLRALCQRLVGALHPVAKDFEIILVEDCGPDRSWQEIETLAASDSCIRGVRLTRNFGQHAATICGISKARGKWVVTLDDDLEQRPEDIPALIDKARQGFDLVYGVYPRRSHSIWRNMTSAIARKLFRVAIPSLNYEYTSFRIIEGSIARTLVNFDSPFPFVDGYLSWLTNRYSCVEVAHERRSSGSSNYNFRKLLTHTINIFVTFSDLPLRFASWIGIGSFVIGMIWLAAIIVGRFVGGITVSGFASLMAGIILFGGIQLLILGIMGEYLGRMNFKSSRKPLFLVSQQVGFEHVE